VVNLAVNARDAMPGGGALAIRIANAPNGAIPKGAPPGRYVRLSVADTGRGLAPEVEKHLFEPFFTTKPVGKGTGLGLAIVHSFVQQCGGHIAYENRPGKGTTFHIYLPVVAAH
jgi:signal transduction histidine kinase